MNNIVDLENLDFRDRLIKEYIDEHSHSGGGDSNYMNITIAIKRAPENEEDIPRAYIGVPEGTDVTDLSLKFLRHSRIKNRILDDDPRKGEKHKYNGWHEIWTIPQKDKVPLFNFIFKDKSKIDFTKAGYDFYEFTGVINDIIYDSMFEYVNCGIETGYKAEQGEKVYYPDMLRHKKNGICIIKDDKKISNVALFQSVYSDDMGCYRLTTCR